MLKITGTLPVIAEIFPLAVEKYKAYNTRRDRKQNMGLRENL